MRPGICKFEHVAGTKEHGGKGGRKVDFHVHVCLQREAYLAISAKEHVHPKQKHIYTEAKAKAYIQLSLPNNTQVVARQDAIAAVQQSCPTNNSPPYPLNNPCPPDCTNLLLSEVDLPATEVSQ